jgi:phage terminase large subunit-like protein
MQQTTIVPTATESRLEQLLDILGPDALLSSFTEDEWNKILFDWEWNRRERQDLPAGNWASVVVQAGRGWGKTRYGVEAVRFWAENQEPYPMYLVGPTGDDVRSVMVEGESGIMAKSAPDFRPIYEPSKRRLIWPNGVIAYTRSGDRPDRLRGPQGSKAWVDEVCAMRYGAEVRDQLDMMIRLGDPRVVYTTTPRPSKLFRELIAEPDVVVIRGTTLENKRHLSPKFMRRVYRKYENTRLGKQELGGELLGDNPGALWKLTQIDADRVLRHPIELKRVGVGVDPAVTSDPNSNETGIVVAGIAPCRCMGKEPEMHGFVFDDRSGIFTPDEWAKAVKDAYYENHADRVVPEVNNGGDLVVSNIRTLGDKDIAFVTGKSGKPGVHASRGKQTRAEPVAALYEQHKVHHVGTFSTLEDQLTQWNPLAKEKSPDRLDALVWVLTWLMLNDGKMSMADAYGDGEDDAS